MSKVHVHEGSDTGGRYRTLCGHLWPKEGKLFVGIAPAVASEERAAEVTCKHCLAMLAKRRRKS